MTNTTKTEAASSAPSSLAGAARVDGQKIRLFSKTMFRQGAERVANMSGIDQMRAAVRMLDNNTESVNQRYEAAALLKIWRAAMVCGWDFFPDQWTRQQLDEAIDGIAPDWDDNERPVFATGRVRGRDVEAFIKSVRS
jgi:hypothetical protein